MWLGIQDVGQIKKVYGQEHTETICNSCGTAITFAVGDPETAEFLSKRIGDAEFVETEESVAMGGERGGQDGITISRRYKTERLVLPSEIARLKDLEMFVQIPNYDMVTAKQTWRPYPVVAEALSMRQDMLLSSIGRRKAGSSEDKVAEFLEKVRTGA